MTDDLPQRFTEAERIRQIEQKVNGLSVGGGASDSTVVEDDDGTIRFESGLLTDGSYGIRVYDSTGTPVSTGGGESTDIPTASQIEFTPTGTISSNDVQAAIAEVAAEAGSSGSPSAPTSLNVKDYGAIADGSAHLLSERYATLADAQVDYSFATTLADEIDWAALQLAANVAKPVFVPSGTYIINRSVLQPAGSVLWGQHPLGYLGLGTTIRAKTGSTVPALICSANWYNNDASSIPDANGIVGLQLDGQWNHTTGGPGGHGFVTSHWKGFARHCTALNCGGAGFLGAGFMRNGTSEYTGGLPEIRFDTCHARNCVNGVYINSSKLSDGFVVNCVLWEIKGDGIYTGMSGGWLIQGNHTYGIGASGIYAQNMNFTRILDNYSESYGQRIGTANSYGILAEFTGGETSAIIAHNNIHIRGDSLEGGGYFAGDTFTPGTATPHGIKVTFANTASTQHLVYQGNICRYEITGAGHPRAGSTGHRIVDSGGGGAHIAHVNGNLEVNWATPFNFDAALEMEGTYRSSANALVTEAFFAAQSGAAGQVVIGGFGPGGAAGFALGSAGTVKWITGTGTPEGVVTGSVGSLFTRTDGGAGTTLYVKQSGTGNTGWVAK